MFITLTQKVRKASTFKNKKQVRVTYVIYKTNDRRWWGLVMQESTRNYAVR